jgi:hypothetical protein
VDEARHVLARHQAEPVQFTGWKQFTKAKNDRPPTPRAEILRLWPAPLYIQIQ